MLQNQLEFRAPPPSPVTTFKSCLANEERLDDFLQRSVHVPDLMLPYRLFPREELGGDPPEIDFALLALSDHQAVTELVRSVEMRGCFQLVNHVIPWDVVSAIQHAVGDFFRLSADRKMVLSRSFEQRSGYEEFSENELPTSEEFFWCREEEMLISSAMQSVWPEGCYNFRKQMKRFCIEAEDLSSKVLQMLYEHSCEGRLSEPSASHQAAQLGPVYCFYKHHLESGFRQFANSLHSDVLRLLIQRSDFSHSLSAHFPCGSSQFRVYTKTGWFSFIPSKEAIIFTIGDQIQKSSEGKYRHVMGRSMSSRTKNGGASSVALLYSLPHGCSIGDPSVREKIITIRQQMKIAVSLIFLYHLLMFFK